MSEDDLAERVAVSVGGATLSAATLAVVAVTARVIGIAHVGSTIGRDILLTGCLVVVCGVVLPASPPAQHIRVGKDRTPAEGHRLD